jgi:heme/copper-type cytochrome/quinol oxidase subunit 1
MIHFERIIKKLQRRIYDVMLTKYGLLMIIFCIILIIASLINFGDSLIEYKILQSKASVNSIQENRFQDEPIDVVYTWVCLNIF